QRSYAGTVKHISLHPPFNTGRDLIYPNDFEEGIRAYLEITGQLEGGIALTSNTEASGRYHTNWLNLMYPRLILSRALLRRDGVLICSIDENELTDLACMLIEVFEAGIYAHVCVIIVQ